MSFLSKISQVFSKNSSNQRIGIAFQQDGISICSIPYQLQEGNKTDKNKKNKVIFKQEQTNSINFVQKIQAFCNHNNLEGNACIVLSEIQSQVVQIDKPSVPDSDIHSALKWQIKDLVSIPPENMLLDYYDAPTLSGGKEKINVVCAPLAEVKKLVTATQEGLVNISTITTQEFAFANLLPAQSDANLLVCQQPNEEVVLIIVKQKQIYFHRRLRGFSQIGIKTKDELESSIIDNISLEIQRSTDYFERQLKQAPIKAIKVLLPIALENFFVDKLSENAAAPVSLLDIPHPYHQHREFAAAIGACIDSMHCDTEYSPAGDYHGS